MLERPKIPERRLGLTGGAERALLEHAHLKGVHNAMEAVCGLLGHVRRGDGGHRLHAATCCWIATTHYTSRPVTDADGVWPGDAQLHDHSVLPAVVRAEDGRLGKPDFGRLRSAVKTLGATYQAETAAALRRCGVGVSIDPEQGAFKLDAIPQAACDAFSKRTRTGWRAARTHAGPGFDGLRRTQRVGLLKAAIQGDPRAARRDDIAQPEAWQAEAAPFLPNGLHVVDPDRPAPTTSREDRLAIAIGVAGERLVAAEANGERMLARTAAAIGLIAAGLENREEIGEVAAALGHADALADAFDAIGRKRRDGTAVLVKGDADATIAAIWIEQNTGAPAPDPVQVATPAEAQRYNAAIRSACREQGLIGRDLVSITIGDPDDQRTIGLARGDRITLLASVNGRSDGGRRGRVASAGGTATVVDIDDDGIVVATRTATNATIRWETLYDPASKSMSIDHAYASAWPCRGGTGSIAVIDEGSAATKRLGVSGGIRVLFLDAIERAPVAASQDGENMEMTDEHVWAAIMGNLAARRRLRPIEAAHTANQSIATARLKFQVRRERSIQGSRQPSRLHLRGLMPVLGRLAAVVGCLSRVASALDAIVSTLGMRRDPPARNAWAGSLEDRAPIGTIIIPGGMDATDVGLRNPVAAAQSTTDVANEAPRPAPRAAPLPSIVAKGDADPEADAGLTPLIERLASAGAVARLQSLAANLRHKGWSRAATSIMARICEAIERNGAMIERLPFFESDPSEKAGRDAQSARIIAKTDRASVGVDDAMGRNVPAVGNLPAPSQDKPRKGRPTKRAGQRRPRPRTRDGHER